MTSNRTDIEDFLAQHRIAIVGVSRDPKDFSRNLFREMCRRGYDMVPVNLFAEEMEGRECFQSLHGIHPKVDGVLLMTPFWDTERMVHDCVPSWASRGSGCTRPKGAARSVKRRLSSAGTMAYECRKDARSCSSRRRD